MKAFSTFTTEIIDRKKSLFKKNTKSIIVFHVSDMILQVWCKDSRGDKQTNAWLGAAGHALRTEWTIFKIRQALPNSVFN